MKTLGQVRDQLVEEELVSLEQAEGWSLPERGSAWYISLLIGVGAWVSAILLLCTMGISGLLTGPESCLFWGSLFLFGSVVARWSATPEFLQQLALAGLVCGELMALIGLPEPGSLTWGVLAEALLLAPLYFFRDRAGRALTALIMGVVLLIVVWNPEARYLPLEAWALGLALLAGFCWLRERSLLAGAWGDVQPALGYASVITLFGLFQLAYWDFFHEVQLGATASLLMTACVLWMVTRLQRELAVPMGAGLLSLGGVLALGAVTWAVPGLMAGVGILILGFSARDRVLQGLAWAYLLVFGTTFYYELSLTLLEKSAVLVASGVLFLTMWRVVRRA